MFSVSQISQILDCALAIFAFLSLCRRSRRQLSRNSEGYGLASRGSIPCRSIATSPILGLTQPPTRCLPATLSLGIKQSGREADDSPPRSAEVKNDRAIPPLPHTSSWRGA
jgi:hypothetical protein